MHLASPPAARRPDADATAQQQALRQALDALTQAELRAEPSAMTQACQQAARCYRDLGETPSALAMLERALRWAGCNGGRDQGLDLHCELAELMADMADRADLDTDHCRGRALRERARDLVFDATRAANGCADPGWEVTLLLRLSDVLDRFGDHDDATALQVRALQLTVADVYAPMPLRAEHALAQRGH